MIVDLESEFLKFNNRMGWNKDAITIASARDEDLHKSNIILKNIRIIKRNINILHKLKIRFKTTTDKATEDDLRKTISLK